MQPQYLHLVFFFVIDLRISTASIMKINFAELQVKPGTIPFHLASGVSENSNFTQGQCDTAPGMTGPQRAWCRDHLDLAKGIRLGTTLALGECHRRFAARQWNCPKDAQVLAGTWRQANRESAFLQAIVAAGTLQIMARMCAWGHATAHCNCDRLHLREEAGSYNVSERVVKGKWLWGGCGDDLQRAHTYTRQYFRSFAQPTMAGELAARQNYRAGWKVVRSQFRTTCKCMGFSAACTISVCWKSVSKIHAVGEKLYSSYKKAKTVPIEKRLRKRPTLNGTHYHKKQAQEITKLFKRYKPDQLVYYQLQPSYCDRNVAVGSPGTRGRNCTLDEHGGPGRCGPLCCFRGHTTTVKVTTGQCKCRFVFCCRIECEVCTVKEERHTCN